jgi:CheY-like chemotaxis protein
MVTTSEALSVLVVDEEPDILAFFARLLAANGMRVLLARTPREAVGIANRGYVPIDVVLTDVALRPEAVATPPAGGPADGYFVNGRDLMDSLRNLRPELRALYMSAYLDSGVIRIQLMDRDFKTSSQNPDDEGLIDSIRRAAARPMVRHAGGVSPN